METKWTLHERGECKPCAYFHHKQDGCRQGEDCEFCHLCGPEALKMRKKLKSKRMKAEKQLATHQEKSARCGLGLHGRSCLPNGPKEEHVLRRCKDGMIINQTPGKGHDVQHDKSDDESTQAPSEGESTDRKLFEAPPGPKPSNIADAVFAPPPGLEHPGLSSTLSMHGLHPSTTRGTSMCGHLSEPMHPAYVDLPAPMNFRSEAVSVSFISL
eukprot:TRINITY_DN5336_c0_g1_i2.p1 TRINITY_DN5336_c0_g1~~TRINITY_DN5336_c0_g1_i2.p1  ORF type:complete len:213 (+),score=31.97 TRINITY_DN5336_c0_g1_i2:204-842(+)